MSFKFNDFKDFQPISKNLDSFSDRAMCDDSIIRAPFFLTEERLIISVNYFSKNDFVV